jgi:hypothetical protein
VLSKDYNQMKDEAGKMAAAANQVQHASVVSAILRYSTRVWSQQY